MAGHANAGMSPWSSSGSSNDAPSPLPALTEEKPRKMRAFCLPRMKSKNRNDSGKQQQLPQQPVANNNNNMPFIIHCQIGKEIKHICSNCRGADPQDGEWREKSENSSSNREMF